jgi:hypothetical protein
VTGKVRPTDRAAWQRWASDEFGADQNAVTLGTDTVLNALIAGYDPVQAQEFARQAVAASRHGAGVGGLFRAIFQLIGIAFRLAGVLVVLAIFGVIAYLGYLYLTGYFPNAPHF